MPWYRDVKKKLEESNIFTEVRVMGSKIRANISDALFLEVYHDPTTGSYSYGLVDLTLPYRGDKRILGWDDYPHEKVEEIRGLKSYPHHFQRREREKWTFEESRMRGDVLEEIDIVIATIKKHLNP